MYSTTIDGSIFHQFVSAVSDLANDAVVTFSDTIFINAADTANVSLVNAFIPNPNPPQDAISVTTTVSAIKQFPISKEDVIISVLDNRISIIAGRADFSLPFITDPHIKARQLPPYEPYVTLLVNGDAFRTGLNAVLTPFEKADTGASVWFEFDDTLTLQDHGRVLCKVRYDQTDYTIVRHDQSSKALFSKDYLDIYLKHLKKFDEIKICMKTNGPMILSAETPLISIAYAIMPRVEKS